MKYILILTIALILVGCEAAPVQRKLIVDKIQAVETYVDQPRTVFYLLADDGTVAPVNMVTYSRCIPKETTYECNNWKTP